MSIFRDIVKADRDMVFLNPDEFGEKHVIDGKEVMAVVDEPQIAGSDMDAVALAEVDIVVFAKCEDLPTPKAAGDSIIFDGRLFNVQSWRVDCGMAEIALAQNISR